MKLTKFIQGTLVITLMALIYIHLQMQIFDLAYQGKTREKRIQELADVNGAYTYQILSLKSSSYLGRQLLDDKSNLQFVGHDRIVTLATLPTRNINRGFALNGQEKAPANSWSGLLSFMDPRAAEAQALEQK